MSKFSLAHHIINALAQVCNLIWSHTSHELVSTHGFSSTAPQIYVYGGIHLFRKLLR